MNDQPEQPLTRRAAREQRPDKALRKRRPVEQVGPEQVGPEQVGVEQVGVEQVEQASVEVDAATEARGGLRSLIARNRVAFTASAAALAFLLLGTGAVFAGVATASPVPNTVPVELPPEEPPRELPASMPGATDLRTCSVAVEAADSRFMNLYASVINVDTDEVLFSRQAAEAQPTASVMKLLTAAAAISVLGPNYRLTTRVVEGSEPGTLVLVGGGDATLTRLSSGDSIYVGAARVSDLAAQALAAYEEKFPDVPITKVVLDANYWNPVDRWNSSWDRKGINEGYHSEVTALQVDGDRNDPRGGQQPEGHQPDHARGGGVRECPRYRRCGNRWRGRLPPEQPNWRSSSPPRCPPS